MVWARRRAELLTLTLLLWAGLPVHAQLIKMITLPPVKVTFTGSSSGTWLVQTAGPQTFSPGGTYTFSTNRAVTISVQARAGGGGGSDMSGGSGAGGGGGAYHPGLSVSLIPGRSYTVVVGVGGGLTNAGSGTTLTDSVAGLLLSLGPGTGGSNGATAGTGGSCIAGVGCLGGVNGTGSFADPQAGLSAPVGAEVGGDGGVNGDGNGANIGHGASFAAGAATAGINGAGGGGPDAPQSLQGNVGGNGTYQMTFVSVP